MTGASGLRAGVDIGGTFTDLAVLDADGIAAVGKTLTTHAEPAAGVEAVLRDTLRAHDLDPANVTAVVHGTTLVTNALIERTGATTALLTTAGFRDAVEMGREHRYDLYDLDLELPRPLVPRHLRFGVTERVFADGQVDVHLDVSALQRLAAELAETGIDAVAVSFLHSYLNDTHERLAREVLEATAPGIRVALSSEVNPEMREYERTSTTLANVYVQGLVDDYLADLRERLRTLGFPRDPAIMLSGGGIATVDTARRFPIRMLESGPAGGVLGAVAFTRAGQSPDQMTFDMGGTTAKLCLVEGRRPLVRHASEVDRRHRLRPGSGLPIRAPVIDMIEIGAGGGSIARVDSLGLLTVGPDSAGSEPGPVCYGLGGERCTVTDADVVLGYLDPGLFLGGRMRLDANAAAPAITEQVAEPMGISLSDAAWGIHATVNENMANAARIHAVERGQDPARHGLFVLGGNGPVHGPGVARALGAPAVVVPPAAGVLSALGFLAAPMSYDSVRSWRTTLDAVDPADAGSVFAAMEERGAAVLRDSGVETDHIFVGRSLDMRFVGQGSEIEVPVPAVGPDWREEVRRLFAAQYQERYGSAIPEGVEIEILTWRVASRGPEPRTPLRQHLGADRGDPLVGYRDAYFPDAGGYVRTAIYDRYKLGVDEQVDGPALVQENESTLVLAPGMRCTVGKDGSLTIDFQAREQ
ncbi:MAG: hydantoinase/oxoprolinase family protein [Streptosporangiales bacterium]